jgi:hypothetical protein
MSTLIRYFALILLLTAFGFQAEAKLPVLVDLSTNRSVYQAGETVEVAVAATNKVRSPIDLQFSSGQSFDVKITDNDGKDVWQWSHEKVFSMAIRKIKLPPGKSLNFRLAWKQTDNHGRPVKNGIYYIKGWLTSGTRPVSPKKEITIK